MGKWFSRKFTVSPEWNAETGRVEKVWDIEALFEAVLAGNEKMQRTWKDPGSVGIDTLAVDFVLLDKGMISGSEMPLLIAMTARKEMG